jgi:hypothetical protein
MLRFFTLHFPHIRAMVGNDFVFSGRRETGPIGLEGTAGGAPAIHPYQSEKILGHREKPGEARQNFSDDLIN